MERTLVVGKQVRGKSYIRDRGAIEMVEEAVHLLRLAPAGDLALYYLGALPFVLGLLYFWADMSRSAFAQAHVEAASLGLALLFVWMKAWQSVFCRRLTSRLRGRPPYPLTWRQAVRLIATQTAVHATGLLLLPLALLAALPFAWAYAFYQNVTVLGGDGPEGLRAAAGQAWSQARLWPRANHLLLALLTLFGFFVFLNLVSALLFVPYLLKSLLGVETVFTRGDASIILNTTFLATAGTLTYLCLDPLLKAVYTLRCFYGAAQTTGEDLRVELAEAKDRARSLAAFLLALTLALLSAAPLAAEVAESRPAAPPPAVSPKELEESIGRVLGQREYAWRLPREKTAAEEQPPGLLAGVVDWIYQKTRAAAKTVRRWLRSLVDWLEKVFPKKRPQYREEKGAGSGWIGSVNLLLFAVLAVLVCAAGVVFYRAYKRRQKTEAAVAASPAAAAPDLADEATTAEDLPGDEWLNLAREMIEKGEYRLALRALYLATLAGLAENEMIILARYKSNLDYENELSRRTTGRLDISLAFAQNVTAFDQAWYGHYEVTPEQLHQFNQNHAQIITGVKEEYGRPARPPEITG
ncbi:MAG: hypothetical protein AB1896_15575 [Thermodesulfobacteriota bacterium]